ncbi:MAG: sensor histidine kinase [Syntrophobacteria bacterium]
MESREIKSQGVNAALAEGILEATDEGIIFVTSSKEIRYINRAAREILRCARQNDPLPHFTVLVAWLGFDPLEVSLEASGITRVPEVRPGEEPGRDTVYRRAPPRLCWQQEAAIFGVLYLVRGMPLSCAHAESSGMVLFFKDMKDMQQRQEIISESLSRACHELRTPLACIKNALDLLGSPRLGTPGEQQLRLITLAWQNVERLTSVVSKVVDLNRLETRGLDFDLEEVHVVEAVEQVVSSFEDIAREKGITLRKQVPQEHVQLLGDPNRLGQAIHHLVENAIKFTPAGGRVLVSLGEMDCTSFPERLREKAICQPREHLAEGCLLLTVADTGVGISSPYTETIFSKFTQMQRSAAETGAQGIGLGLSIVKTVVEAHGGTVWVDSDPGKGSTFRVLLPIVSRQGHLVHRVGSTLNRIQGQGSNLTLAIVKVVPVRSEVTSGSQRQEKMSEQLDRVVTAARSRVRPSSDLVDVLDPSGGLIWLLAETGKENFPALLERVRATLREQAGGRSRNIRLVWAMASYPEDGRTGEELVTAAIQAVSGPQAEVLHVL